MAPTPSSITAEALLQHQPWMRALARRLVVDEHEADDLVQEAWLKALEKPPDKPGSLGAWLGTVLRNGARQLARGESRRDARERAVSRREATEATSDVVARAEAQRIIVKAVLGLKEPARTTVLLRFFDGLPPRKIAKQLGEPVETIRARIRRALASMRSDLDDDHGSRRAWAMALIPLARLPAPSGGLWSSGESSVASTVGVLAAVLVGAALGIGGTRWTQSPEPSDPSQPTQADALVSTVTGLERRVARERAQMIQERSELDALGAQLTALLADLKGPNGEGTQPEMAPAPAERWRPAFSGRSFREAMEAEDWNVIGRAIVALVEIQGRVGGSIASGNGIDAEAVGQAQTENAPLVVVALRMRREGVPGTVTNSTFLHPTIMANALEATLRVAEHPLDAAQRTAVERLAADGAERVAEQDASARESDQPRLSRLLAEAALREQFLQGARAVLTAKQRDLLGQSAFRDRLGLDIFTSALIWAGRVHIVDGDTVDTLATETSRLLRLELDEDNAIAPKAFDEAVRVWASKIPESERRVEADALDQAGQVRRQRVERWARHVERLLTRLKSVDGLNQEHLRELKVWSAPIVPYVQPAPDEDDTK